MSFRNNFDKLRLAGAAVATGLALGATANVVRAAPEINPAPTLSAGSSAAAAPSSHGSITTAVSDTAITAKVKMGLLNESRVHGSNLNVTTTNGVVTLTGHTPSSDSALAATQVAQSVKGVTGVDASQIVVASIASTTSP